MRNPLSRPVEAWGVFLFEPQSTSTLALFRIAFGATLVAWTFSQLPNIFAFYTSEGVLPQSPALGPGAWGLLQASDSGPAVLAVWLVLLLAAIALTVGYLSRGASLLVFLGLLAFERRNPFALNSGDILLRNMAFILMLAPSGVALSVDRWRSSRSTFWECPIRPPWALRMLQVQLSVIYFSAVWSKLQGDQWRGGTAVGWALGVGDIVRFGAPTLVTDSPILVEMATFGTLLLELSIAVLVWKRGVRPWVLAVGAAMHLVISWTFMMGFFSIAMLCLYLVFVPPARATSVVALVRKRVTQRSVRWDASKRSVARVTRS